jgi:hypothetical protein
MGSLSDAASGLGNPDPMTTTPPPSGNGNSFMGSLSDAASGLASTVSSTMTGKKPEDEEKNINPPSTSPIPGSPLINPFADNRSMNGGKSFDQLLAQYKGGANHEDNAELLAMLKGGSAGVTEVAATAILLLAQKYMHKKQRGGENDLEHFLKGGSPHELEGGVDPNTLVASVLLLAQQIAARKYKGGNAHLEPEHQFGGALITQPALAAAILLVAQRLAKRKGGTQSNHKRRNSSRKLSRKNRK